MTDIDDIQRRIVKIRDDAGISERAASILFDMLGVMADHALSIRALESPAPPQVAGMGGDGIVTALLDILSINPAVSTAILNKADVLKVCNALKRSIAKASELEQQLDSAREAERGALERVTLLDKALGEAYAKLNRVPQLLKDAEQAPTPAAPCANLPDDVTAFIQGIAEHLRYEHDDQDEEQVLRDIEMHAKVLYAKYDLHELVAKSPTP